MDMEGSKLNERIGEAESAGNAGVEPARATPSVTFAAS